MNIIQFLDEFTNDNLSTQKTTRRQMFGTLGSLGKKAAMAAIPLGLATVSNKTFAATAMQEMGDPIAALQLALTLEYLEAEFYAMAVDSGVITDSYVSGVYETIAQHEAAHVAFLQAGLGSDSVASPTFDFTAGGAFDPFNTSNPNAYAQLLALAQAFEDTGVRAYKGQAGNVMGSPFLTPALQIHSVEAKHASEIRRIRGLKGWITNNERGAGMPEATQAVYNGEENIIHGDVDVTSLGTGSPFTMSAASEAYDEVLTREDAVAIASLFIAQ